MSYCYAKITGIWYGSWGHSEAGDSILAINWRHRRKNITLRKKKKPKQLSNNQNPTMQDVLKSQRPLISRTGTKHSIAMSGLPGWYTVFYHSSPPFFRMRVLAPATRIIAQDNNSGWKIHQEVSSPNSCSQQGCLWGLSRLLRALTKDRDPTTFLSNIWASFYRNQDLECTPHQDISLEIWKYSCFLSFRGNRRWNWLRDQRWRETFTYLYKKK